MKIVHGDLVLHMEIEKTNGSRRIIRVRVESLHKNIHIDKYICMFMLFHIQSGEKNNVIILSRETFY